jgi:hypothetical protein
MCLQNFRCARLLTVCSLWCFILDCTVFLLGSAHARLWAHHFAFDGLTFSFELSAFGFAALCARTFLDSLFLLRLFFVPVPACLWMGTWDNKNACFLSPSCFSPLLSPASRLPFAGLLYYIFWTFPFGFHRVHSTRLLATVRLKLVQSKKPPKLLNAPSTFYSPSLC